MGATPDGREARAHTDLHMAGAKNSYEELRVWQAAIRLVQQIYRHTENFPARERFGLTAQLRRAAVSVPSNIAEGHDRHREREFLHFLDIAQGSRAEVETQLRIAEALGYMPSSVFGALLEEFRALAKQIHTLSTAIVRMSHEP